MDQRVFMIVIYHFEAKNSKKIFGPNATSRECTSSIFCWPWRFLTSMDEKLDKKISNSEFQCLIFGFRHCAYTAPTNIFKISWKCIIWRKTNTVKGYKRGFEDVVLIQLIDKCTSGVSSALIGWNQADHLLIWLHPAYYAHP